MNVSESEKAEKIDALHAGLRAFVVANVFDARLARIVLGLCFEVVATSSGEFAGTIGRCDGLISRDETIEHVGMVVDATDLSVSADLENWVR
jgi:2-methylisocitrate lyase-like PEP mutase family enzyme